MSRGTAIVVTAVLLLVTGVLLVVFAFRVGETPAETAWVVGSAERLAPQAPLLFQDPRGGDLDVWVHHLADDQWVTFLARTPGQARGECELEWQASQRRFRDPCTRRTYPEDGTGLRRFHTTVDGDGRVVVDFSR